MQVRKLGVLAGLVGAVASCSSEEQAFIVAERGRFRELAPEQYVIAACGTGDGGGCTREVVIGGRVVTAEVAAPGDLAWRPVAELDSWIDQVSSMYEVALDAAGSLRSLEFEPRWHFVREYHLDADEEDGRKVTCFLPHRVDLQQCRLAGTGFGAF